MRRICWPTLALLLLFLLVGCGSIAEGQSQQAVSSPTSAATRVDGNISTPVQATPDPTATATATPDPTPVPTVKPTARPTSPPQSGSSPFSVTGLEKQLQQQLYVLINQDRGGQGLYAYSLNNTMSGGALLHSKRMASCGMSHQCPGEADPCQRVSSEGISWTSCGENVGYTSANPTKWAGVQKIEQDMLAEQPPDDGHRQNLLNTSYHRVGVGIYIDSGGLVWITEDFAS